MRVLHLSPVEPGLAWAARLRRGLRVRGSTALIGRWAAQPKAGSGSALAAGPIRRGAGLLPVKLAQSKELEFAPRPFGSTEIMPLLRRQSPKSWAAWAASVPRWFFSSRSRARVTASSAAAGRCRRRIGNFLATGDQRTWTHARADPVDPRRAAQGRPGRHRVILEPSAAEPRWNCLRTSSSRAETFRDDRSSSFAEHAMSPWYSDDDEFPCIDADTASFAYVACNACGGHPDGIR